MFLFNYLFQSIIKQKLLNYFAIKFKPFYNFLPFVTLWSQNIRSFNQVPDLAYNLAYNVAYNLIYDPSTLSS